MVVDAAGELVITGDHAELPADALAVGFVALGATTLLPRRRRR